MGNFLKLVYETTNTPFVVYGEIGVTCATGPFKIHFAPPFFFQGSPNTIGPTPDLLTSLGSGLSPYLGFLLIWCCPRYLDLVVIIASHLLNERIGGILSLSAKSALYLLLDRDFSNASLASCLSLKEGAFPAQIIRSICCRRTIKTHLSRT